MKADGIRRCFVAIGIDDAIRARLEIAVGRLRRSLESAATPSEEAAHSEKISWTRPSGWHVTLKFLGGIAEARIATLVAALSTAVAGFEPFRMTFAGIHGFPIEPRPQVLAVGVRDDGKSSALAERVDAALAELDIPREEKQHVAHLTLARLRGRNAARGIGSAIEAQRLELFGTATVEHIGLYESFLERGGARYCELAQFALAPQS